MQTNLTTPTFGDPRLPTRFWAKVHVLDNGCWEWTANRLPGGYGIFRVGSKLDGTRRAALAHRWAYECLIAPIPQGLEPDHPCHNSDVSCSGGLNCPHRRCVNPAHMEPVTHRENIRRGRRGDNHAGVYNASKTHCPQGHTYIGRNLYIVPTGGRKCRTCNRLRAQRLRHR